jgi:hypothetical protein
MAGLFGALTAARAEAQRFGRLPQPRAGACFYRDANFRGDYFCVRSGDAIDALPNDLNDQISSIRMLGGEVEVTIFQNREFKGKSKRFGEDVRNLRDEGWNDRLSSVRVQGFSRSGRDRDRDRGFGRDNGSAERIVRRAYQDILNREPDEAGLRLYRSHIIDDHWTEEQVRETLRGSPEYRTKTTMTRERATEIVRLAYLSVLNREPDAASQGYIDHVLRDKWTEEDVARELRKSPEARGQGRGR